MRTGLLALALAAVLVPIAAACGSDDAGDPAAAPAPSASETNKKPGSAPTSTAEEDSGAPPTGQCPRLPKPDDHARKVVISRPYDAAGAKANVFEVLELGTNGDLTKTSKTFSMGRSLNEIVFTPDGEIGLVAQENGTLGVFKFDATGNVTVVHAAFSGPFYAARVVVSHDGSRAWILDRNTKENNGGLYEVKINCDGTLSNVGMVLSGGKAHAMALVPTDPDRAVLIAGAAGDSPAGDYSHRLDMSMIKPARILGGVVFTEDAADAIASWVAITPDGKWALVTDDGLLAGMRMAPIEVATMKAGAAIPVSNPAGVVMSPFGNAALLLESTGTDHLRLVTYDAANATTPFAVGAEVAYKGGPTQLPAFAFAVDRGTLKGRVIVAENQALRTLSFGADGSITDVSLLSFDTGGDDFTTIVGSLGLQP